MQAPGLGGLDQGHERLGGIRINANFLPQAHGTAGVLGGGGGVLGGGGGSAGGGWPQQQRPLGPLPMGLPGSHSMLGEAHQPLQPLRLRALDHDLGGIMGGGVGMADGGANGGNPGPFTAMLQADGAGGLLHPNDQLPPLQSQNARQQQGAFESLALPLLAPRQQGSYQPMSTGHSGGPVPSPPLEQQPPHPHQHPQHLQHPQQYPRPHPQQHSQQHPQQQQHQQHHAGQPGPRSGPQTSGHLSHQQQHQPQYPQQQRQLQPGGGPGVSGLPYSQGPSYPGSRSQASNDGVRSFADVPDFLAGGAGPGYQQQHPHQQPYHNGPGGGAPMGGAGGPGGPGGGPFDEYVIDALLGTDNGCGGEVHVDDPRMPLANFADVRNSFTRRAGVEAAAAGDGGMGAAMLPPSGGSHGHGHYHMRTSSTSGAASVGAAPAASMHGGGQSLSDSQAPLPQSYSQQRGSPNTNSQLHLQQQQQHMQSGGSGGPPYHIQGYHDPYNPTFQGPRRSGGVGAVHGHGHGSAQLTASAADCGVTGGGFTNASTLSLASNSSAWAPFDSNTNNHVVSGAAMAGGSGVLPGGSGPLHSGVCGPASGALGYNNNPGPSGAGGYGAGGHGHSSGGGGGSFEAARRLVSEGGAAAAFVVPPDMLARVSMKIANCTPQDLPPDLYDRLCNLLRTADASLVQGFLRPGCTHLVLDVLVRPTAASGPDGAAAADADATSTAALDPVALRDALGPELLAHSAVLVQTEEEVCLWPAAAPPGCEPPNLGSVSELQAAGELPVLDAVSAAAHVPPYADAAAASSTGTGAGTDTSAGTVLVAYGRNLAAEGVHLFARCQGGYLPLTVTPLVVGGQVSREVGSSPQLAAAAAAASRSLAALARAGRPATDALLVTVREAPGTGLLLLEAQAGPLLSNWRPCLLSTDATIAAELSEAGCRALRHGANALANLEAFVTDLGRLLDLRSYVYEPPTAAAGGSEDADGYEGEDDCSAAGGSSAHTGSCTAATASTGTGTGASCATSAYGAAPVSVLDLVCLCERLVGWSTDAGLAAISTFLVSALRSDYRQDMQSVLEAPYNDGSSVVVRCLRSGSAATVRAMLGWAAASGVSINWSAPAAPGAGAAAGLSPLHVAAVVPATWRLLAELPEAKKLWAAARARRDGATPLHLQRMMLATLPPDQIRALSEAFAAPRAAAPVPAASAAGAAPASVAAVAAEPAAGAAAHVAATPDPRRSLTSSPKTSLRSRMAPEVTPVAPTPSTSCSCSGAAPATPYSSSAAAAAAGGGSAGSGAVVYPPVVPFVAALALIALAALASSSEASYVAAAAVAAALCYSLHTLRALSRAPSHRAFVSSLGSRLLPHFAHPHLETEYAEHRRASLAPLDMAGVSAVLLVCCGSALGSGGGAAQNLVAAVNVTLTLLPLLVLQAAPKPFYARNRCLLLVGPYVALFNVVCGVSQASCSSPVALYGASLALASLLLPVNTAAMLLIMAYTAMHGVRGVLRRGLGWPPSEACASAQMAVVAAVAMVVYARELAVRQAWVVRAAAQRKVRANKQA